MGIEKKAEAFDEKHWNDVRGNMEAYLRDNICVPYASGEVKVHSKFNQILEKYVGAIQQAQSTSGDAVDACLAVMGQLQQSNADLLHYSLALTRRPEQEATSVVDFGDLVIHSLNLNGQSEQNKFVEIAYILARGAQRAAYELMESVTTGQKVYILHHQAILYDLTQEMIKLAVDSASHFSTEKMLENEHPHHELLEEKWKRDNIQ